LRGSLVQRVLDEVFDGLPGGGRHLLELDAHAGRLAVEADGLEGPAPDHLAVLHAHLARGDIELQLDPLALGQRLVAAQEHAALGDVGGEQIHRGLLAGHQHPHLLEEVDPGVLAPALGLARGGRGDSRFLRLLNHMPMVMPATG